jgi:hypothetical protein
MKADDGSKRTAPSMKSPSVKSTFQSVFSEEKNTVQNGVLEVRPCLGLQLEGADDQSRVEDTKDQSRFT